MEAMTRQFILQHPELFVDPRISLRQFPEMGECDRCHNKVPLKEMYDISRYTDIVEYMLCQDCIDDASNMFPCTYCGRRKHVNFEKDFRGIKVPVCKTCMVISEPGEEPKERHECNCKYCTREYE